MSAGRAKIKQTKVKEIKVKEYSSSSEQISNKSEQGARVSGFKQKLRCFLVRSARDVAAQALPNWAQIAVSLAQNFHDVFVALPPAEQAGLIEVAEGLSASEWGSMRAQVEGELGGRSELAMKSSSCLIHLRQVTF